MGREAEKIDFSTSIRDAGFAAVSEAKVIYEIEQDKEVREEFLSALMARNLHFKVNMPVRVEVPYTTIWAQLNDSKVIPVTVNESIGDNRADIVIYERRSVVRPAAIVEVKVLDERVHASSILSDLAKAKLAGIGTQIPIYGAVFLCETGNSTLQDRENDLCKLLPAARLLFSEHKEVANRDPPKKWRWCFGCITATPEGRHSETG